MNISTRQTGISNYILVGIWWKLSRVSFTIEPQIQTCQFGSSHVRATVKSRTTIRRANSRNSHVSQEKSSRNFPEVFVGYFASYPPSPDPRDNYAKCIKTCCKAAGFFLRLHLLVKCFTDQVILNGTRSSHNQSQ